MAYQPAPAPVAQKSLAQLKEEICDIGRRIYAKGFAAGNDGNISFRLNEKEVLCTPTMISKGFMKPSDLCIVDMEGNQIGGNRKRSSEVLLHLTIMKERPDIRSVVHCHPPHATAFAVAREPIPQCVLPEVEVFLGDVPITRYETPGGQKFADTVKPFVKKSNVVILANHGTVSFGETVEKAYWWTEILDAYCRILMLAKDLGRVTYLTTQAEVGLHRPAARAGHGELRHLRQRRVPDELGPDRREPQRLRRPAPDGRRSGERRPGDPPGRCRSGGPRQGGDGTGLPATGHLRRLSENIHSDEGFQEDVRPGLEPGGALEISPPERGGVDQGLSEISTATKGFSPGCLSVSEEHQHEGRHHRWWRDRGQFGGLRPAARGRRA